MGSVLKFIKGLGKAFIEMPTSTKLKLLSGATVLIGGIAIAAGAATSDDIELLEGGTQEQEALPTPEPEIIEVEPTIVEG